MCKESDEQTNNIKTHVKMHTSQCIIIKSYMKLK